MFENLNFQILALGLDEQVEAFVQSCFLTGGNVVKISRAQQLKTQSEFWRDDDFAAIFCSANIDEISVVEIGKSISKTLPKTAKYFITYDPSEYTPAPLLKSGFSRVFLLPQDKELVIRTIREEIFARLTGQKTLKAIKMFDLKPNTKLDFATYLFLPLNNRFIEFSHANEAIDEARLKKLYQHHVQTLYIDKNDLAKFYKHSADVLKKSATESQEALESCVRGLLGSVFDKSADPNESLEICHSILSNFLTDGLANDWYSKLVTSIGDQDDPYNHASRVSTFASLFAIGLGYPNPKDLANAAVFHDLGMADVPDSVSAKPTSQWSKEEKSLYEAHPTKSLSYLNQKGIEFSAQTEIAILKHHDKFIDGENLGAQILSYADQFDYLTRIQPQKRNLNPQEAHRRIEKSKSISEEVLTRIGRLMSNEKNT